MKTFEIMCDYNQWAQEFIVSIRQYNTKDVGVCISTTQIYQANYHNLSRFKVPSYKKIVRTVMYDTDHNYLNNPHTKRTVTLGLQIY